MQGDRRASSRSDPDYAELLVRIRRIGWSICCAPARRRRACRDQAAGLRAGQAFAAPIARAKRAAGVADFDDLIAWTRRLLGDRRDGRLGPLQARPAHRPYPGRRSAGHQRRPMGDRRGARRGIFQRRERGRARAGAPCSWSATSSRRSSASRAPTRSEFEQCRATGSPAVARLARRRTTTLDSEALAREFRDLSIDASFRSAPAILDVVDARDRRGRLSARWACRSRPTAHRAHFDDRPGAGRAVARRSPPRTTRMARRARRAGSARRDRLYADALAEQVKALARRSAGARHDRAAAERRATS